MHAPGPTPAQPAAAARPRNLKWLWAVGGAAAASVVWLTAVLAAGGFRDSGEPSGSPGAAYRYAADFCDKVDARPFTDIGLRKIDSGMGMIAEMSSYTDPALDVMKCSQTYEGSGTTGSGVNETEMRIHKRSAPGPELEAKFRAQRKLKGDSVGKVEQVSGLGEQAFLASVVSSVIVSDTLSLVVRDGRVVLETTWDQSGETPGTNKLTREKITDMLKRSAQGSLANMRSR